MTDQEGRIKLANGSGSGGRGGGGVCVVSVGRVGWSVCVGLIAVSAAAARFLLLVRCCEAVKRSLPKKVKKPKRSVPIFLLPPKFSDKSVFSDAGRTLAFELETPEAGFPLGPAP